MRIAINTRLLLGNKLEGIGRFTYELLKVLVAQHPEHTFIFLFDRASSWNDATQPGHPNYFFRQHNNVLPKIVSPPARHPFLWYWWFERSIPRVLQQVKADVFLSPDGYCSLQSNTPTVMVTHDIGHHHFPEDTPFLVRHFYNRFVPQYLRRAERVVTVSQFVKQDLIDTYRLPSQKIAVACNAIGSDFRQMQQQLNPADTERIKKKYSLGRDYFLYTGAIHPRKNVDRLIKAFDLFKKNATTDSAAAAQLLLAGRMAWQLQAVTTAYEQATFKKDIHFLGFVPTPDLVALMAAAKCFIYVSRHEGFGIPLLEAMHCRTPIITSDVSALPEVAGDAALSVNPFHIDDLADAMQQVWNNEALRNQLVQKALQRKEAFTWEQAAKVVYEQLEAVRK